MRPDELPAHWLGAARDPEIAADLRSVYAETAAAIAERAPACWASGRCCNFEKSGHLLYVTGLEAAYAVAAVMDPVAAERQAAVSGGAGSLFQLPRVAQTPPHAPGGGSLRQALRAAPESPGCPFQRANLCSIHAVKPLACRVYFCDRSATVWQNDLAERMHARVRAIHEERGVEYRYAEWRGLLAALSVAVSPDA